MNKHTDGDPLAELAALRQRLSKLEAEYRELKRQATRARNPVFFRKFLFSALPVALLLAGVGVLYAVDALFIDTNGNVRIGGAVGVNTDAIPGQQLVIQPKDGNIPFSVTNPAGKANWLSVLSDGKVIMNGGNVGIGTTSPDLPLVVGAPTGGPKIEINDIMKARWTFGTGDYMLHIANDFLGHWTDRLVINQDGNVGIGTTSPSPDLPLSVGVRTGGPKIAINDVKTRWAFGTGKDCLHIANHSLSTPGIMDPWTDRLVIGPSGTVYLPGTLNIDGDARLGATLEVAGPVMDKFDVIQCPGDKEWGLPGSLLLVYFKDKLKGKPLGTHIRAIANNPGTDWADYIWDGWVGADGKIKVAHLGPKVRTVTVQ